MSEKEANNLLYDWEFWARPNQLPPDWEWYVWLILSGRGFGKTRIGSETVIQWAKQGYTPIALIGQTKADVRDTMIELGESSILKVSPPWFMPVYESSKRRLVWPNGVIAVAFSGDEPDQLRGPQHMKAWADEPCKFKRLQETWDNLMFGLRLGDNPQVVATTTPRPIKWLKDLLNDKQVAVTKGHTLDNRVNLAPKFVKKIIEKYEGTRLGRQELAGEVLEDNPGALWKRGNIDKFRVNQAPELIRIVVGVDPEAANNEGSAETGIIVAGIAKVEDKLHGYVLDDLSIKGTPREWATAAVTGYHKYKADCIVAEVNQGGDMVESTIQTVEPNVAVKKIHASRGKATRAEPASALYEQGRGHHVGFFTELEDQLCEWVPGDNQPSPDRLDALAHAFNELFGEGEPGSVDAEAANTKSNAAFAGVRKKEF